ncbi:DUF1254 domain-containing protein [Sandaracinobacteroides hominis]|uniref:DUF1254 domain-containing protein n=1 Tax=Sandaracinobacteroides hominis TaxID=2780086 RepID=UPI0018F5CC9E|nr:DUF1254 domain-containing protein [Sandaracinobacteroides hominis]
MAGPTTIGTRIGALSFTHDMPNGYPTPETLEKLFDERDFQRACQAYLWALPIVSFAAWQRSQAEQLGAANGQLVSYLSYVDKLGILTANATTPYYVGFVDLAAGGPHVLDLPLEGVRGGLTDFWQRALPGSTEGGRYLILGPGQEPPADAGDYKLLHTPTFNNLLGVRVTVTDPAETKTVLGKLRFYPHARRADPPAIDILAAADRPWSGMPPRDLDYWQLLSLVINREPMAERDHFFLEMLKPLGIEKGRAFAPDARQAKLLAEAVLVGEAMAKANAADRRFNSLYRPGTRWDHALNLDADNVEEYWGRLDERASWFYEAVTAAGDMSPKRTGVASSAYLGAYRDSKGEWLDGGNSYVLRVPPDAPAELFWSLTVYDVDTRCLINNPQQIADRSSRMKLTSNADGSIDIHCGPEAPAGFESNWIPTLPGKAWFAYFRLYNPTQAYFDASWPLPDFERKA